jgi:hypothetical protein
MCVSADCKAQSLLIKVKDRVVIGEEVEAEDPELHGRMAHDSQLTDPQ